MSLYLSRMLVNPLSVAGMRLLESPDSVHSFICALFEGSREDARFLFRVDALDGGPAVLIQSAVPPDWGRSKLAVGALRHEPETKPFDVPVEDGAALAFRLLTRPAKRAFTGAGHKDGPRRDLRTDEERLAWIRRKGESCGFRVVSCGLTLTDFPAVHAVARGFREAGGAFTAVRFDGELGVTDAALLRDAVANGIGTQKAFGFGLLSLAPVR